MKPTQIVLSYIALEFRPFIYIIFGQNVCIVPRLATYQSTNHLLRVTIVMLCIVHIDKYSVFGSFICVIHGLLVCVSSVPSDTLGHTIDWQLSCLL